MCDSCGCNRQLDHTHTNNHSNSNSIVNFMNDDMDKRGKDNKGGKVSIGLKESLFEKNRSIGDENRKFVEKNNAVMLNLISAPGSGKTSLLEATIEGLGSELSIGVIEGDIETERDAQRIRDKGAEAVQITTGGACHLDAILIKNALYALYERKRRYDLIFIENVGNLVCPSSFFLGERIRCVLVSVPEGPDKPAKYPSTFKDADVFLISKIDLLDLFDFSIEEVMKEALRVNPLLDIMPISAKTGENMDKWLDFLVNLTKSH